MKAAAATHSSRSITRLTVFIVLGSESILFGTLLSSYLFIVAEKGTAPFANAGPAALLLPAVNTIILVLSAWTAARALRAVQQGHGNALVSGLQISLALGLLFVLLQIVEYNRSGFRPDDNLYGGIVMALIGFHAFHVVAGTVFLGLNLFRARLGDFTSRRYLAIEASTWFWYYVTLVWIVLFIALYWIR